MRQSAITITLDSKLCILFDLDLSLIKSFILFSEIVIDNDLRIAAKAIQAHFLTN